LFSIKMLNVRTDKALVPEYTIEEKNLQKTQSNINKEITIGHM